MLQDGSLGERSLGKLMKRWYETAGVHIAFLYLTG
jgi:hypothetical protein